MMPPLWSFSIARDVGNEKRYAFGMRLTLAEIAQRLETDKETVRGIVKFLVEKQMAQKVGERKSARGAAEAVFAFNDGFVEAFATELRKMETV